MTSYRERAPILLGLLGILFRLFGTLHCFPYMDLRRRMLPQSSTISQLGVSCRLGGSLPQFVGIRLLHGVFVSRFSDGIGSVVGFCGYWEWLSAIF